MFAREHYNQSQFDIRCEWGLDGLRTLLPVSEVVIIVDVLSFSTSVDLVVARGGQVYPIDRHTADMAARAIALGAELAGKDNPFGYSLSPRSLEQFPPGGRLALPSLNGAVLSLAAGEAPCLAGCLRNAQAVAKKARRLGKHIAVIPAGERWLPLEPLTPAPGEMAGRLRPALEDWLGAGAVIASLTGSLSPEAEAARAAFLAARQRLDEILAACGSGKELLAQGGARDLELAADCNISQAAPQIMAGAYKDSAAG